MFKNRPLWVWIVLGIVIFFIIAFIPYYYTASPKSCSLCHNMEKYYSSWQKSLHGQDEVACSECHVKPGWFPYVTYRIGFYREIFAHVVGLKLAPWGATTPGNDSCTRDLCHSENRLTSPTEDIKINHKAHAEKARIACVRCHNGVTHPGVGNVGTALPPQKLCLKCHIKVKDRCTYCHSAEGVLKKASPH